MLKLKKEAEFCLFHCDFRKRKTKKGHLFFHSFIIDSFNDQWFDLNSLNKNKLILTILLINLGF